LVLLRALGPVLTPFVVGAVLAYALTPLVDLLDEAGRGRLPRVIAVVLVELLLLLALSGLVLLVLPIVVKELPLMRQQLPAVFDWMDGTVRPWLAQFGIHVALDVDSLKDQMLRYLHGNYEDFMARLMSSLKVGGSLALALSFNVLLTPVALFYLLLDWDRFVHRALELVPPRNRPAVDAFTQEADQVLGQYLRGQLLVMLIMAAFYSVGLALFGLDLALPIGLFTGLAMFVPYLGFGIGLALALIAGLLQFASVKALAMVAVVYGTGQLVEGFYFTPRFVGERIGLHPLAVIFALLAAAPLFGFVGVLVALPASAVLLVAIRRVRSGYMASRLYQGG
jgi:predicted PurR-regulated permease PerM